MNNKPFYKRISWWGWVLIVVLLFVGKVGFNIATDYEAFRKAMTAPRETRVKVSEPKAEEKQVKATVNFTGTKFVITNANDFDWGRAKITINEKYSYEAPTMNAGVTYEVGAAQFTDRAHNRFNPFETKPAELRIYVREPVSDDWYGDLR